MRLWLLRHARVMAPEGLCYGASDLPAHPEATAQAAERVVTEVPAGLPVWVSGLTRTQQLAAAVQARHPRWQAARIDTRLNEMDFGQWEMRPWAALPREAFDRWTDDFAHHRVGGAESTQQVIERVAQVVLDLHRAGVGEAVWVTHAGVIAAAHYLKAHGPRVIASAQEWPRGGPQPGEWRCLDF